MTAALLERIGGALDAGAATATDALAALLLETGGERCHRRERITHLLVRYLTTHTPLPMSPSTTHRFKADFARATFELHDPETRSVTARNLTDADVPLLIQYGGGHLIEPLPAAEKKAAKAEAKAEADDDDDTPKKKH